MTDPDRPMQGPEQSGETGSAHFEPPTVPPYQPKPPHLAEANSKKILCGLLAIFLGNFGVHKFVLGYNTAGVIMVVISVVGFCPLLVPGLVVMRVISIIEGIMYLTKSDEEFYRIYMVNKKEWF